MCKSSVILLLALIGVSAVSAQYNVNPCFGRPNGFARDFNSCAHYFRCTNGQSTRDVCPNNRLFDAEREECVVRDQANCFQCPQNEAYRLLSVPNACPQYILCFLGRVTLNACPDRLVFDGRIGIQNCNIQPPQGGCFRENDVGNNDPVIGRCPVVTNRPIFIPDRRSCSV